MHQLGTVPQFNKQADTRYRVLAVVLGAPIALADNGEDSECSSSRRRDKKTYKHSSLTIFVKDVFLTRTPLETLSRRGTPRGKDLGKDGVKYRPTDTARPLVKPQSCRSAILMRLKDRRTPRITVGLNSWMFLCHRVH